MSETSDVERISMQGPFEPNCSGCGEFIQEDQVIYTRHEGPPGVWGNSPWCRACYMRTFRPEAPIKPDAPTPGGPSRDWLRKAGDIEDAAGGVSVGGLAADLGLYVGVDRGREWRRERDALGRVVREAWVRWAKEQPDPKPHWLLPYDDLSEPDKEADRQIGEAVVAAVAADAPKPLRWTTEPPKVPGWYWMKTSIDSGHHHMIEYPWPRPNPPEYRYAGPIPEPVDDDEPDAPTLRDEAAAVLVQLDELAAIWGDEGVFRRCRDRLRAALAEGGGA